jgi:hypothetical protein
VGCCTRYFYPKIFTCITENTAEFTVSTVVNQHGWEQGALNADGTSKSAEEIDFGPDPGASPPPESSYMSNHYYLKSEFDLLLRIAVETREGQVLSGGCVT